MALTVNFWTFSKKENSTAIPSAAPAQSLTCVLKSDSGILRPVLEIGLGMAFNPYALNYSRIAAYDRYYYVTDWQWSGGLWLCSLQVDALASYRSLIGNTEKYVLRSAYKRNLNVIDTLYPAEQWYSIAKTSVTFPFVRSFQAGSIVMGICSKAAINGLPVSYYKVSYAVIEDLMDLMYPSMTVSQWEALSWASDELIKAVYDPISFIIYTHWFPFNGMEDTGSQSEFGTPVDLAFGNVTLTSGSNPPYYVGQPLNQPIYWGSTERTLFLPSSWLTQEAKYRAGSKIFIHFDPWGVIELEPSDFSDSREIRLRISPNYIAGTCKLAIYKIVGSSEYLLYQRESELGVEIVMSNVKNNAGSALNALTSIAGAAAAAAIGAPDLSIAASMIGAAGSCADALLESQSSLSRAGQLSGAPQNLTGEATLILKTPYFTDDKPSEFGYPLYEDAIISSIPGYIKCGDGDISLPALPEEIKTVSEYLTGGFYYE